MYDKVKEMSAKSEEEVIRSIGELVKIPSYRNLEDKGDGAPFGKEIGRALDKTLDIAKGFGMRTYRSPEGFYGYIEVGDENLEEMVGIIGHLDVVPPGDASQWLKNDPFLGEVIDGKLYGRGTLDDKGPVVIALYGLKNLLDSGFEFKKRVRIILGTTEETTWEGITEYIKKEELPTISFSPDAEFPLINAEKTVLQMDAKAKSEVNFEVEALGAYNAVPDKAIYRGEKLNELCAKLDELKYDYTKENNEVKVIGKSAHAMEPEKGINALVRLCIALYEIGENSKVVDFIAQKVKETHFAELIHGNVEDEISGKLKYNVSRIQINEEEEYLGMDSRIPVLIEKEEIIEKYKTSIEQHGLEFSVKKVQDKLYVEEDSFLVSTLMNVYKKVTGEEDAKPLSTGGGTYARAFDNCVAFGVIFQSQNQINNMHQPQECFETRFIIPALEIYTLAIYELSK